MTQTARPAPAIYALTIERFRDITFLKLKPSRGVNFIIGGSDVGKTTILEVITLLLSVWAIQVALMTSDHSGIL
jgi:predicted ATP-dependent endonuclease of OLD family